MKKTHLFFGRRLLLILTIFSLLIWQIAAASADSPDFVNIKFHEGSTPQLSTDLQQMVTSFGRLFTLPDWRLEELYNQGGPGLPDLRLWYRAVLIYGTDVDEFINRTRELDNVAFVEKADQYSEPPAAPDMEPDQLHLDPATNGINAEYAWTFPGGDGSGVTIYDVEGNWNQTHEDLTNTAGVTLLMDPGDSKSLLTPVWVNHGTSVLGILVGDDNSTGVKGIACGADIKMAPEATVNLGTHRPNAIMHAVNDGEAGDVILYEMQTHMPSFQLPDLSIVTAYGPAEWNQAVFEATQVAIANGFIVVAAAGNGSVDLDNPFAGTAFDRSVRDSGAIIVGAGKSPGAGNLERCGFSSYGDRVDVQAWGENIISCGYNEGFPPFYSHDPADPTNEDSWYTNDFGGTSGASAIVAGAVADLQGFFIERFGTPMTAFQMRALLRETGTPQVNPATGNIGPRPDLRAAIDSMLNGPIDIVFLVDISGSYEDDLINFEAQAPDLMTSLQGENPNTQFALAIFQDYPIDPFGRADMGDVAYELRQQLTSSIGDVNTAIANLSTQGGAGGDNPESQLTALYQLATGAGQTVGTYVIPAGQQVNFRSGATKLILLWTDDIFHLPDDPGSIPHPGNSIREAAEAVLALDPPQILGIAAGDKPIDDLKMIATETNSFAPEGGVDWDDDGIIDIAEGEPLVLQTSTTGDQIGAVMRSLIKAGIRNRSADVAITMTSEDTLPEFMRVGESATVTVTYTISNNGPSGPVDAQLIFSANSSASLEVTPESGTIHFTDIAIGGSRAFVQTFTVTSTGPGMTNLTFSGRINMTSPVDSTDRTLINNMDQIALHVSCLTPIHAEHVLDLRDRVLITTTTIYGGNDFRLGADAHVEGNVLVNGNASLRSRARIEGNLTLAGNLDEQQGAEVIGSIIRGINSANVKIPAKVIVPGSEDITVHNDQSDTWSPGSYGNAMVRARGTVVITAGEYNFQSLRIEPDSEVIFDTTGGVIEINVADFLEIGDRAVTTGGSPTTVTLYSNTQGTVRLGTNIQYNGALVAPYGDVRIFSRTAVSAHIWAENITIEPDVYTQ